MEIAQEMDTNKIWVSRTVKKLKDTMLINEKGTVTDQGLAYIALAERQGKKNGEETD